MQNKKNQQKEQKEHKNTPSLILRLVENLRKNPQHAQRQFQDRRQLRPIPGDRQAQLVDGEVDGLCEILRIARFLEDQESARVCAWSGVYACAHAHCEGFLGMQRAEQILAEIRVWDLCAWLWG